jgi:hypothetical protein
MRRWLPAFYLAAVALLAHSAASAAVPSPSNSQVAACLSVCPTGDLNIPVVVRDFANNPINGSTVVLDFSACPGFVHCPPTANDRYRIDDGAKTVSAVTDMSGRVDFNIRMGGTCPSNLVRVFADGVLLASRSLASPDQDANLVVNAADTVIVRSKMGSSDPTADLDCNGVVSEVDYGIAEAHLQHACDLPTSLRRMSWRRLKIIYR